MQRDDGESGNFESVFASESNLATSYLDYFVEPGKNYRYRYRARNINGWGDHSPVGYVFAASKPEKPSAPSIIKITVSLISL